METLNFNSEIKINEIFYSIQGESSTVGYPTIFVRTTGCNLRCTYCDTKYSYFDGSFLSLNEIIQTIKSFSTKYVCITGGEPLLQKSTHELMHYLVKNDYNVSLETSGSKSIEAVHPQVRIILDVKTPDSGASDSFLFKNLKLINQNTEFKFVICSENDFEWAVSFCRQHEIDQKYQVLFSPSYGVIKEKWLAEQILKNNLNVRLQLQLHKYIWLPETRGV